MEGITKQIPQKPDKLIKLEIIKKRKSLNRTDRSKLAVIKKGYQGELYFATLITHFLSHKTMVLYDLFLEWGDSYFQIDCLVFSDGELYLLDIKNFEGNYVYQNDNFYSLIQEKYIKNPLHQLKRGEILLQDMLNHHNLQYTIHAYLVFIHSSFILYEAPITLSIIYSRQMKAFMKKMNTKLKNVTNQDRKFALMLKEKHLIKNNFAYQPDYVFESLKRGIFCLRCNGLLHKKGRKLLKCAKCHMIETYESAVLRMVIEFATLFPDEKLTLRKIYRWTGGFVPVRRISSIMKKYMNVCGSHKGTYYKFDNR